MSSFEINSVVMKIVSFISPFLSILYRLGDKAADKAVESAGEKLNAAAWCKAKEIWKILGPKIKEKASANESALDLVNNPEEEDNQAAFRVQVRKLLETDLDLKVEIEKILSNNSIASVPREQITQAVTGDQNQVIGNVTGGIVINNVSKGE